MAQLLLFRNPQLDIHSEFRSNPLDRTHSDPAVHHVYNAFGNGQAQPGTAVQRGRAGKFLGKRLKNMRKEFLAHPDAGIIYNKAQHRVILGLFAL